MPETQDITRQTTIPELTKFREKYPQYSDLDDSTIADKLSKKYPDAYGDLPGKLNEFIKANNLTQPSTTTDGNDWLATHPVTAGNTDEMNADSLLARQQRGENAEILQQRPISELLPQDVKNYINQNVSFNQEGIPTGKTPTAKYLNPEVAERMRQQNAQNLPQTQTEISKPTPVPERSIDQKLYKKAGQYLNQFIAPAGRVIESAKDFPENPIASTIGTVTNVGHTLFSPISTGFTILTDILNQIPSIQINDKLSIGGKEASELVNLPFEVLGMAPIKGAELLDETGLIPDNKAVAEKLGVSEQTLNEITTNLTDFNSLASTLIGLKIAHQTGHETTFEESMALGREAMDRISKRVAKERAKQKSTATAQEPIPDTQGERIQIDQSSVEGLPTIEELKAQEQPVIKPTEGNLTREVQNAEEIRRTLEEDGGKESATGYAPPERGGELGRIEEPIRVRSAGELQETPKEITELKQDIAEGKTSTTKELAKVPGSEQAIQERMQTGNLFPAVEKYSCGECATKSILNMYGKDTDFNFETPEGVGIGKIKKKLNEQGVQTTENKSATFEDVQPKSIVYYPKEDHWVTVESKGEKDILINDSDFLQPQKLTRQEFEKKFLDEGGKGYSVETKAYDIKDRNRIQAELMQKAGIPEKDMADYATDSVADGKILGQYAEKVIDGSMTEAEAIRRVKSDYQKMISGKKEAPNLQETGKQKEPWEMTKDEFEEANYNQEDVTGWQGSKEQIESDRLLRLADRISKRNDKASKEKARELELASQAIADKFYEENSHETQIKKALSEGKPVPEEVLKDYPDLQEKFGKISKETAKETKTEEISSGNIPDNNTAAIQELLSKGRSTEEIAKALNVKPGEVVKIAEKYSQNIPDQIKSDMPKGINSVKVEYESGKSSLVTKQDIDTIVEPKGDKIKNVTYGNVEFNKQGGIKPETFREKIEVENKIFTEDKYKKAKDNIVKKGQQLTSGIDPTLLKDYIDIAGYHIEKGARTFTEFSKRMIEDLGEKVKPYLQKIWEEIKEKYPVVLEFNIDLAEKLYDKAQKSDMPYRNFAKLMRGERFDGDLRAVWDEIRAKKKDELLIQEDVGLNKSKIEIKTKAFERQQKRELKNKISDIIFNRRANIDVENFKTSLFVDGLNKTEINGKRLTKEQKEVIPFLIEKTDIPKNLNRPDLEKIYSEQKEQLQPIADKVSEHFDKMWEKIVANTDKLSTDQIENYVTHIWDIPKTKVQEVTNWFTTKNRFLKKRYVETIKEGVDEFDLKPKTLDITDIIKIHDSVSNNAIENAKFVRDLKTLTREGLPLMLRADKAPSDWIYIDHPALTTTMYIPPEKPGLPAKIVKMPYKIHPDLKEPLDVIFGKKFDNKFVRTWEQIDAILKKTALSLSLFHHGALIETGVATTNPIKVLKLLGKETILRGAKEKYRDNPILSYPEETMDAMKHGVQFGHTLDIDVRGIQKTLDNVKEKTKNVPGLNLATNILSTFNKKWDKALWDYIHDPLKLYAYIDAKTKMPKNVNPENYLRVRAQLINDTFGGQNWETMMVSPKSQQIMRWFLLSPDWTISTIRQALSVTGFGGKNPEGRKIRAKAGTKFWLKAGLYFGTGINALNYYYRKQDEEEHPEYYKDKKMDFWDYTMFGNSIGHKTHLFTGRYDDGSERYVRWGKQFRELPELIMDEEGINFPRPLLKKIGGKAAPLLQLGSQIFTGKSLSGYENWNLKDKKGWDYTIGLLKTIGESALPFSSQVAFRDDKEWSPTDLMMPSSKGMTKSKVIDLFKKAIIQNDIDYVKEVYSGAVRNNLDAFELFGVALSSVKAEGTRELLKDINNIDEAKKQLQTADSDNEKKKIKNKITRLKKEQENKNKGFERLDEAIEKLNSFIEGEENKPSKFNKKSNRFQRKSFNRF